MTFDSEMEVAWPDERQQVTCDVAYKPHEYSEVRNRDGHEQREHYQPDTQCQGPHLSHNTPVIGNIYLSYNMPVSPDSTSD